MGGIQSFFRDMDAYLRPIQPPPDLESRVQSSTNQTDYIDSARKEIGLWIAAAAPLAVFYYQSQPNVPSLLRLGLFCFVAAAVIYFTGIHINHRFPGIAKGMVKAGVVLAAITNIGATLSMMI